MPHQVQNSLGTINSKPVTIDSVLNGILNLRFKDVIVLHLPSSSGIVLTACLPIYRGGDTFEGVACVDMLMRDLISELTAFQNLDIAYTFMLDGAGTNSLL